MRTVTKRAAQGAIAVMLALGGIASTAGTAQAAGTTDFWSYNHSYWLGPNNNTGRCVDDSEDLTVPDHNLLRGFGCYDNSYAGGWQRWLVIGKNNANGSAQLFNAATGLCLDDSTRSDGSDYLRGLTCYADSFSGGWQAWRIVNRTTASGSYQQVLQNVNTGRCLDDSNAGNSGTDLLRGYPCNGSSQDHGYQGWDIYIKD
ncbi:RICIN domain-containing protein [Streptomyces griseofuscus]|uniref:RICIN domain-containing protein n=1 Tax=Streptomyces griseofuscus TaxID=146922 RepID=UPI0033D73454